MPSETLTTRHTPRSSEAETLRLAALRRFVQPDWPPEPSLHVVAALAREAIGTPGAAVSVVDDVRQCILAEAGPLVLPPGMTRACAPCATVVESDGVLVIPDLATDARFRDGLLARAGLRFYAGASLRTPDGQRIGTVCVISEEPRPAGLSAADQQRLQCLADAAMAALELRLLRRAMQDDADLCPYAEPAPRAAMIEARLPGLARPGRPPLAAEIVARIRALRQTGRTMADIASTVGVAVSSVHKVLRTSATAAVAPAPELPGSRSQVPRVGSA